MNYSIIDIDIFNDSKFAFGEIVGNINTGDSIYCQECGSPLTMLEWLPPYQVAISKKKIGDFIHGTFGIIVSEKFMHKYLKTSLKGIIRFSKVDVYYKENELTEASFYYPHIVLSDVKIDLLKSHLRFNDNRTCGSCQKAGRVISFMNGLFFHPDEKILEDIFYTKMIGKTVIVSGKFVEFVLSNDFSNINFVNASDYKPSWII